MIVAPTGNVATDHQTDLHLVVKQAHMLRLDDVVDGASDRPRRLAEERERHLFRVPSGVLDVRREVGHLGDDAHGSVTGASSSRLLTGTVSVLAAAGSMRAVGQQLRRRRRVRVDLGHGVRAARPPASEVR